MTESGTVNHQIIPDWRQTDSLLQLPLGANRRI
jgi:hypothetical protein